MRGGVSEVEWGELRCVGVCWAWYVLGMVYIRYVLGMDGVAWRSVAWCRVGWGGCGGGRGRECGDGRHGVRLGGVRWGGVGPG